MKAKIVITGTKNEQLKSRKRISDYAHQCSKNKACMFCGVVVHGRRSSEPCPICDLSDLEVQYKDSEVLQQQIAEHLKNQGCAYRGGDSCHCAEANLLATCEYVAQQQLRNKEKGEGE